MSDIDATLSRALARLDALETETARMIAQIARRVESQGAWVGNGRPVLALLEIAGLIEQAESKGEAA